MLTDAKVSHNEFNAFGSELCRLFQLALHAVFQEFFFKLSLHRHKCMFDLPICQLHAHSAVSAHSPFQVNGGWLTLLNFPKEASTRQKLIAFLFLVDFFCVDLFTSST